MVKIRAIVLLLMFNLLSVLFLRFFERLFHGNFGKDAKTRVRESVCQLPFSVISNTYHIFRAFLPPKIAFLPNIRGKNSRMDSMTWVFESVPYIFNSSNSNPFFNSQVKSKIWYCTINIPLMITFCRCDVCSLLFPGSFVTVTDCSVTDVTYDQSCLITRSPSPK